jgi:hypothetical protein
MAETSAKLRKKGSGFTQVPNLLINDSRISFRAKGIWTLIESKPDGWIFREVNLITCSTEGRDAFRAAAKELIEFGWLKRFQERNSQGHFVTIYELMYEPLTENPSAVKPSTVHPSTENQASYKDGESKKEEQSPLPPAGPRGGVWDDDSQFMELLSAYALLNPDRADARKAWDVWVAKGLKPSFGLIMRALNAYSQRPSWKKEDRRYVPALSKWLGDEEWRQVAAGIPTAEELAEQRRISKAGLDAYARIQTDQRRSVASAPADLEAVRLWQEQQDRLKQKTKESVE